MPNVINNLRIKLLWRESPKAKTVSKFRHKLRKNPSGMNVYAALDQQFGLGVGGMVVAV